MSGCIIQIIGLILGAIGIILTFAIMLMPQWRTSTLVESNALAAGQRIDGQWINRWEGLWTTCLSQANLPMQCNSYKSMVSITSDIKAARILVPFALVISIVAFITALVGMLLYLCCGKNRCGRNCLLLTGGIGFILATLLLLIPVSWITSNIANEVYDPKCKTAQKIDIGEAIFLAWPTLLLLLIAGIVLCLFNPCIEREESCEYLPPKQQTTCEYRQVESKAASCESVPHQQPRIYNPHQMEKRSSSCENAAPQQQTKYVTHQLQRKTSSMYSKSQYI